MTTIRRILFPTDFSEAAQNAFLFALMYASKTGTSLKLLHVVMPEYEALDLPVMAAQATKERIEAAQEVMRNFVDFGLTKLQTTDHLEQLPEIDSMIEVGGISETINKVAAEFQMDLIIMGTRSQHTIIDKLFGSISANVLENAPCAVIIIPENAPVEKINVVAYASDLRKTDPYNIWKASKILDIFHPILHCVHIRDKKEDRPIEMAEIEEFFKNNVPTTQLRFEEIEESSITEGLNEFVENHGVDLLVISSPQRSLLEKIFHKSISKRMTLFSKVPILILKF